MKNAFVKNIPDVQEERETHIPLNLQFFADDPEGSGDDSEDEGDNDDPEDEGDDEGDQSKVGEKTFTQKQVTALMAREKKEGRRSILKALGFKSEAEAKSALGLLQQLTGKGTKTDGDTSTIEESTEVQEALQRAEAAEAKLACIAAGVNKESIEDALAIAKNKVTDKKTLEAVLVEMSKEVRYASFFDDEQSDGGTGSDPGHVKNKDAKKAGSYGARLAASTVQKKDTQKSSYF